MHYLFYRLFERTNRKGRICICALGIPFFTVCALEQTEKGEYAFVLYALPFLPFVRAKTRTDGKKGNAACPEQTAFFLIGNW
ncbi:MAG: hypothetical protein M3R17_00685, partial [Bacteroidota bacterium]|nr:hypothetical protein [Bacteroidota bacterium]